MNRCTTAINHTSTRAGVLRYKVASFLRFKEGKLIEYQSFADSFDMMQQALGRQIDVPRAYPVN